MRAGREPGLLGLIFRKSQNRFRDPAVNEDYDVQLRLSADERIGTVSRAQLAGHLALAGDALHTARVAEIARVWRPYLAEALAMRGAGAIDEVPSDTAP